jgi:hypothetical protein
MYIAQLKHTKFTVEAFKSHFFLCKNIEKYIAIKNSKVEKFEAKWSNTEITPESVRTEMEFHLTLSRNVTLTIKM